MLISNIFIYIAAFFAIWFGAGLIIKAVDRISCKLNLSSFCISFFILGILTSIPETSIGFTAVSDNKPDIFVGTLLGGVIVMYLFVIPVLAVFGKGIKISSELNRKNLILALAVTAAPGLLVIDGNVTNSEGLMLLVLYLVLFYVIQRKHGILDKKEIKTMEMRVFSFFDMIKVMLGIGIVFIASQFIVNRTIYFSESFDIPVFFISLIVLSIGTNLPELSLALKSVLTGKKEIALGDYIGSAAFNTFLFGIFILLSDGEVITVNNFLVTFIFILSATGFFYFFYKSRKEISAKEGWIMLGVYGVFLLSEILSGNLSK